MEHEQAIYPSIQAERNIDLMQLLDYHAVKDEVQHGGSCGHGFVKGLGWYHAYIYIIIYTYVGTKNLDMYIYIYTCLLNIWYHNIYCSVFIVKW